LPVPTTTYKSPNQNKIYSIFTESKPNARFNTPLLVVKRGGRGEHYTKVRMPKENVHLKDPLHKLRAKKARDDVKTQDDMAKATDMDAKLDATKEANLAEKEDQNK
jgi:hypothetical protein